MSRRNSSAEAAELAVRRSSKVRVVFFCDGEYKVSFVRSFTSIPNCMNKTLADLNRVQLSEQAEGSLCLWLQTVTRWDYIHNQLTS